LVLRIAIEDLEMSSYRPVKLYPDYDWPVMNLRIWPKPARNTTSSIYVGQRISRFAAITDVVNFRDHYPPAASANEKAVPFP